MFQSALIKSECDEFVEFRGPCDGSDIATTMSFDFVSGRKQDRTAAQFLVGFQQL